MAQGALPFQYAEERRSAGVTALAGLAAYLDLAQVAGLHESVRRHLVVNQGRQGWTDSQIVISLMLLNLAGGECVEDMRLLEKDDGVGRLLRLAETHGMRRRERRALLGRWRRERRRNVPSASAAFRFLNRFHDEEEERRRLEHTAFIPATIDLQGAQSQRRLGGLRSETYKHKQADMDATLVETHKEQPGIATRNTAYAAFGPKRTWSWAGRQRSGGLPATDGAQGGVEQDDGGGGAGAVEVGHWRDQH